MDKSIETEGRQVVTRSYGSGKWRETSLIGEGFYFGNVLKLDRGGGYVAL